jgi:hypothetical protein
MSAPGSSGSESTCTAQGRYRDGMRAASLATRVGAALQNSLVCTPQLKTAVSGACRGWVALPVSGSPKSAAPGGRRVRRPPAPRRGLSPFAAQRTHVLSALGRRSAGPGWSPAATRCATCAGTAARARPDAAPHHDRRSGHQGGPRRAGPCPSAARHPPATAPSVHALLHLVHPRPSAGCGTGSRLRRPDGHGRVSRLRSCSLCWCRARGPCPCPALLTLACAPSTHRRRCPR